MTPAPSVTLSHAGVFVTDLEKMTGFYTGLFGFVVSDRGDTRSGGQIVFLTGSPDEHHQFVLATGRPADLAFNVVNQISFRVDSLATLRRMQARVVAQGIAPRCVTHGNALSVYFNDPEGNRLELLIDTPWHVPLALEVDLSLPDEQLWQWLEAELRSRPGFKARSEWQDEIAAKLKNR